MNEATAPSASAPWGVLLVDKPEGPTSHDVVGWVRWALGESQVGHCGTLDPAASGLLVLCVGPATRLVPYLTGVDKSYRARIALGRSTTTEDREGSTVAYAEVSPRKRAAARTALAELHGLLMLSPPAFSAVKVAGQRAHRLARRGQTVELPPRPMTVLSVHDLLADPDPAALEPWIEATMTVSKGTYLRTLAVELGRRVGVPAHLGALRRVASGPLDLADPRTVTGLLAEPLPARPGLPPKLRLRWPAIEGTTVVGASGASGASEGRGDARQAISAALQAALIDPCDALGLPLVVIGPDDPRVATLTRLRQGQAVTVDAGHAAWLPSAPILSGEGLPPAPRLVLRDADGIVVVRREATADGEVLRPERVLGPSRVPAPTA
ncbi:MAG: tRNA pseudouridine(55) synthase TruB [Nannocystis sp.]|uniref:tRNA pseudouridine(55) synthase TruB n=1 Tax=Nannocystis sp. TaxID=1962667 RepID=UPI0024280426|nr:tRNA pseudouridine(55) synthase TruB [Nannocystis sp.]MBK9754978.1 tRNA pseudouridine(55) synthase TruB [Nannocystis sp.]